MIASFGDKLTESLYHGTKHKVLRRLPPEIANRALRKLDMINAAHDVLDLRSPPETGWSNFRVNSQACSAFASTISGGSCSGGKRVAPTKYDLSIITKKDWSIVMIPTNRIPTHPGKILKEEFLDELGVSQVAFSAHIKVPVQRINEIVRGKRGITSETAWLLAQALDTTPEFWTNLQSTYDLAVNRPEKQIEKLRLAS